MSSRIVPGLTCLITNSCLFLQPTPPKPSATITTTTVRRPKKTLVYDPHQQPNWQSMRVSGCILSNCILDITGVVDAFMVVSRFFFSLSFDQVFFRSAVADLRAILRLSCVRLSVAGYAALCGVLPATCV